MSKDDRQYVEGDNTNTAIAGFIVVVLTFGFILYCALTNPALDTLKY